LGAALVIGLLAKWAGVGLAIAYGLHIAVDYPTHSGEWSVRPWYPFSKRPLQGVSSAWEWPMAAMARAWGVWALVLVTVPRPAPLLTRFCPMMQRHSDRARESKL